MLDDLREISEAVCGANGGGRTPFGKWCALGRHHRSLLPAARRVTPMKALNIIITFLASTLFVGCASTWDGTVGQSSVCEVHHVVMIPKRVAETFGMKVKLRPVDTARPQLFPHADEPYDTGACARAHDYWRVYVCPACTEARTRWLATQPQNP
jgi:hypothetical protein